MVMSDGQVFTYHSDPNIYPPEKADVIWLNRTRGREPRVLVGKPSNYAIIGKLCDYNFQLVLSQLTKGLTAFTP